MRQKSSFIKGLICGLVISLIILLCMAFVRLYVLDDNVGSQSIKVDNDSILKKVSLIEELIGEYYLNDADSTDLENGIYKGLLEGLGDPYSVYYTAEEYKSLQESVSGTYSGIGVTVTQDTGGTISIVKPFEDAPGFKAGLRAGDILYAVDDEKVEGKDISTVVAKIKGNAGTTVKISVIRDDSSEVLDFTVERQDIEIPTVEHSMMENGVGYIYIASFDEVTVEQFVSALKDLADQDMKSLVVDLRDNPGGSLSAVVDILDLILPEGLIVYTEDKDGNRAEEKSDGEHQLDVPLSVLVNENSASASEIFAGAVKDYGIGKIVGKTTFGKGVVQSILPLSDGSAVKLTISNYFTPKGNNINGVGVTPDYDVDIPEEAYADKVIDTDEDTQLQKAIEVLAY